MSQGSLYPILRKLNAIMLNRVFDTIFLIDKNLSIVFYPNNTCEIIAKRLSLRYDMGNNFSAYRLMQLLMKHNII